MIQLKTQQASAVRRIYDSYGPDEPDDNDDPENPENPYKQLIV